MEHPPQTPAGSMRGQRKLRNLLIDKRIQLRFVLTSMLIVLLMCACLGFLMNWQGHNARAFFRDQRDKSTSVFQRQLNENTALIKQIRDAATRDLEKFHKTATGMLDVQLKDKDADVREAAKLAKQALEEDDKKRLQRQQRADSMLIKKRTQIDKEQIALRKHQDLETTVLQREQDALRLFLLVFFCVMMLILIFVFNLVMSHRVAGPLFKIGRYLDEIKDNQLGPVHDLRKTDLLQDFHERFKQMHQSLKERTEQDIEILEALLNADSNKPLDPALLTKTQNLLDAKRNSLQTKAPQTPS